MKHHYHKLDDLVIETLFKNRLMRDQAEIDGFISALEKLRLWKSVYLKTRYLETLLMCLDGATRQPPPMAHLISYIEEFPPDILARTLLKVTLNRVSADRDYTDEKTRFLEEIYLGFLYQPNQTAILRTEYQRLSEQEKLLIQTVLQRIIQNWFNDDSDEMIQAHQEAQSAIQIIITDAKL